MPSSSPFTPDDFASCARLWKEHSGASRACTWLAILRFDYHSLTRQPAGLMIQLARRHVTAEGWHARPAEARVWPRNVMRVIIAVLALVHGAPERCQIDMDPGRLIENRLSYETLLARPADNTRAAPPSRCDAAGFDIRRLPYRWLPGLPPQRATTRALLTADDALRATRLEVMHVRALHPSRPVKGPFFPHVPARRSALRTETACVLALRPCLHAHL